MKLHDNQLQLLRHLARFNLMDYLDCLALLDTTGIGDRMALSYTFRSLTKNKYVSKRKDGCVSILAKGRTLFPEVTPLISAGGGAAERRRVMEVSRIAALMERHGIPSFADRQEDGKPYFIPSACWRKIAPGILSTTRFVGMLLAGEHRLAVYDIGDGAMEWQVLAEGSLLYTRHGSYETRATGMLLVCREDAREQAAKNIIRQTMWNRRQPLRECCVERDRPVRWSRSPIKLKAQYGRVYLTTPAMLTLSLDRILGEEVSIQALCEETGGSCPGSQGVGEDIQAWPRRMFVNPACDLLKYVRFFSAVKSYLTSRKHQTTTKRGSRLNSTSTGKTCPSRGCTLRYGKLRRCPPMYTDLNKTLTAIGKCLTAGGRSTVEQLHRMYDLTQWLLSQELAVICDLETYGPNPAGQERLTLAQQHASGRSVSGILTLTLWRNPSPP